MEKELKYLKGAVDSPVRPMACIVGGAKVSSKVKTNFARLSPHPKNRVGALPTTPRGAAAPPPPQRTSFAAK